MRQKPADLPPKRDRAGPRFRRYVAESPCRVHALLVPRKAPWRPTPTTCAKLPISAAFQLDIGTCVVGAVEARQKRPIWACGAAGELDHACDHRARRMAVLRPGILSDEGASCHRPGGCGDGGAVDRIRAFSCAANRPRQSRCTSWQGRRDKAVSGRSDDRQSPAP